MKLLACHTILVGLLRILARVAEVHNAKTSAGASAASSAAFLGVESFLSRRLRIAGGW